MNGQGVMEYLIALVIILVLGLLVYGIVGGLGEIVKIRTRSGSESFWAAQEIAILPNYRISTPGIAELTLKNNKPFDVEITGISFNGIGVLSPASLSIAKGYVAEANVSGIQRCSGGQTYSYVVAIKYNDLSTRRNLTLTGGNTNPLIGNCEED